MYEMFNGKKSLAVISNNKSEIEVIISGKIDQKITRTVSGSKEQMAALWEKIMDSKTLRGFNRVFRILNKTFHIKEIEGVFIDTDNNTVVDGGYNYPEVVFKYRVIKYTPSRKSVYIHDVREEEVEGHYGDERWGTGSYVTVDYSGYRDLKESVEWKEEVMCFIESGTAHKNGNLWHSISRQLFRKIGIECEELERMKEFNEKLSSVIWRLDWGERDLFREAFKEIKSANDALKKLQEKLAYKDKALSEAEKLQKELKRLTWAKYNAPEKDNPERRVEIQEELKNLEWYTGRWSPRFKEYSSPDYVWQIESAEKRVMEAEEKLKAAKKERADTLKRYLELIRKYRELTGKDINYWDYSNLRLEYEHRKK